MREKIGDFYVNLLTGPTRDSIEKNLTSSTALFSRRMTGCPTVMHFYDGGWGGCRPCAAQMKLWSTDPRFKGSVQFLCVCVESAQVALAFHNMFDFGATGTVTGGDSSLVNGYIPSRSYMPVGYGQLGCSGFIVSDSDGNFVSRKTAAYLQYGDAAFRHVESILLDLLPQPGEEAPLSSTTRTTNSKKRKSSKTEDECSNNTKNGGVVSSSSPSKTTIVMTPPESVGVDAMDDEHKICTDSFNRTIKDPTLENLQELHDILKSHFNHEEELIEKYSNSDKSSTFSALHSHRLDHQRILKIATAEIGRFDNNAAGGGGSSCAVTEDGARAWHRPTTVLPSSTRVDEKVVQKLITAFHTHAENFDALYHAQIPADAE